MKQLEGKRVLFISYNGMLDPLGQSQVIPYLRELAKRGVLFTLLSFERPSAIQAQGIGACKELHRELATFSIDWHWLPYHQRPSLPATAYDVVMGTRRARQLVKEKGIELVHARSHIPATIAVALKRSQNIKLIFDLRGLMAEEYVDANHWRKDSLAYKLTKKMERRAFATADAVVTLTETIWPIIKDWEGLNGRQVLHEVIPCCTDLSLFRFSSDDRSRRRAELGLGNSFTIVYSGSLDGWYLTERMVEFFSDFRRQKAGAHFLWLTLTKHDRIVDLMGKYGVGSGEYTILSARSRDVPSYLSASDVGLSFIKPCFSKLASSPTKNAEYLACGLPIIINSGVGDSDELVTGQGVGALVCEFTKTEYSRAIAAVEALTSDPEKIRNKTRAVAEDFFDVSTVGIERYARLYERVFASDQR